MEPTLSNTTEFHHDPKGVAALLISFLFASGPALARIDLIAIGSIDGAYQDLAHNTATPLESGIAGNRLGGLGSGLA